MDLSDELVQAKCEMLLDVQKPTSGIGGSQARRIWRVGHIPEIGAVCVQAVRETARRRTILLAYKEFPVVASETRQEVVQRSSCWESACQHG